jgi:hypothetical protein
LDGREISQKCRLKFAEYWTIFFCRRDGSPDSHSIKTAVHRHPRKDDSKNVTKSSRSSTLLPTPHFGTMGKKKSKQSRSSSSGKNGKQPQQQQRSSIPTTTAPPSNNATATTSSSANESTIPEIPVALSTVADEEAPLPIVPASADIPLQEENADACWTPSNTAGDDDPSQLEVLNGDISGGGDDTPTLHDEGQKEQGHLLYANIDKLDSMVVVVDEEAPLQPAAPNPETGAVTITPASGDYESVSIPIGDLTRKSYEEGNHQPGPPSSLPAAEDRLPIIDEEEASFIGDLESASVHNQESVSSRSIAPMVGEKGQPQQGLYLEFAEPLPTEPSSSSFLEEQRGEVVKRRHAAGRSVCYRCTLICLAVTVAVIVLSIALPLTLHRHANLFVGDNDATVDGPITPEAPTPAAPNSTTTLLSNEEQQLQEALQPVLPSDLYDRMTNDFSSREHAAFQSLLQDNPEIAPPTLQRFVLTQWDNAVAGVAFQVDVSECLWDGIQCDTNNTVRAIQWNNRTLAGVLPDSMLSSLTSIDLGENALRGSIPTSWYQNAPALENLYLHDNALTGTISTHVAQWTSLRRLFLGSNQLTGSLPKELGSSGTGQSDVRPLGTTACCVCLFCSAV